MTKRTARRPLPAVFFLLLLFFWPGHSSFGQNNTVYELCRDINHISVKSPMAVAVDIAENIYVVEAATNSVNIYNMNGLLLRSLKKLSRPISIAVNLNTDIYVGNSIKGKGNVAVYNSNLDFLFKLGSGDGEFIQPTSIAVSPEGKIYVADCKQDIIKVYFPDGRFDFSFGSSGSDDGQFNSPSSLSIYRGSVVVLDLPIIAEANGDKHEGARLQFFSLSGNFLSSLNKYGQGDGFLTRPLGIASNSSGNIFVADSYQNVVQVFDRSGIHQTSIYSADLPMRTPLDITFGPVSGRLYVASLNSNRIDFYCPTSSPPTAPPLNSYTVTASVNGGRGTISAAGVAIESETNYSYQIIENENISFSISADNLQGYYIENVLIDGVDALSDSQLIIREKNEKQQPTKAEYTLSGIVSDHTVEVRFALSNVYTIAADATSSWVNCGAISPSGTIELSQGESQTFTVSFDPEQCDFLNLLVDGISVAPQANWSFYDIIANHTIRAVFGPPSLDSDGDGIPDYWEIAHGLNPYDPSDADLDSDGDGGSNLDEFLGGTDPHIEDVGAVKNDFNGDGKSDILFRSSSIDESLWLYEMDGHSIIESNKVTPLNPNYEIVHIGDFTGENKVDILIRHSITDILYLFEMDGPTVKSRKVIGKLDRWSIAAVADFTGDGKEDILLREEGSEHLRMYKMDAHKISSTTELDDLSLEWDVAGAGDFNGDGKYDILLRDSSKDLLWLYEMDGSNIIYESKVADIASDWIIAGIADFTGDKNADILFRNATSGLFSLYVMDGSEIISSEVIEDLSLEWRVAGVADYSGDGKADILLRDMATDDLWMYEMDGTTILEDNLVGTLSSSWQAQ